MKVLKSVWRDSTVQQRPSPWVKFAPGELLTREVATRLEESFPLTSYTRLEKIDRSDEKSYRNYSRPVFPNEQLVGDDPLPPLWQMLVDDLAGQEYREIIASVLGTPVATAVEVRLVRHAPGDWLAPHIDRLDKVFSHIIYFNRRWLRDWGGTFEMLLNSSPNSAVGEVVPELGASALFMCSNDAWHQVKPIVGNIECERRSLLVHGLR